MNHAFPRTTLPSGGGLKNPTWRYSRNTRVLDEFRFQRECERRAAANGKTEGAAK